MEQIVELIPQVGVVLDGKAIRLGDTKASVERTLGQPESTWQNSLYYFQSELHIVLDKTDKVEFIEVSGGPDGTLQAVIFGMKAFQAEPETVYELLKGKDGEILDLEHGYSYSFLNLSVGLYRESVPENVPQMILEARADGHPLSQADVEYEKRRTHWAAVGVGVKDCYR